MNNVYTIKNLSYRVANNKIISDISCDINNACISVIKGPNGAGKTTLKINIWISSTFIRNDYS